MTEISIPHCLPYNNEEDCRQQIGQKIKTIRRLTGLSQAELGDMFSVGKRAVAAWEAGESDIKVEYLYMISQAYGIPLDYFFISSGRTNPSAIETYYLASRLPRSLREIIIAPEYETSYPSRPRGNHSFIDFNSTVLESFYEGFQNTHNITETTQYIIFNDYVGNRIAALRKAQGISQMAFSKRVNVSRTTISLWESRSGGIDPYHFSCVLSVLGISPSLFFESNLEIVNQDGVIIYDRPEFINSWPADVDLYFRIQSGACIRPQFDNLEASTIAELLATSPLVHCYHDRDISELKKIYFNNGKNCRAKIDRFSPDTRQSLESKEIVLGIHHDFAKYNGNVANRFVAVSRAQLEKVSGGFLVHFQDEDIENLYDSDDNS